MRSTCSSLLTAILAVLILTACGDDDGVTPTPMEFEFIFGTEDDPQIGFVTNSTGDALTFFRLGDPTETQQVALGASSQITPTGMSVRDDHVIVPLGNAASVALIDPAERRIERFFLFPSGNATGSAFVDDNTVLTANFTDDYVGRFTLDQTTNEISAQVDVAPAPTHIVVNDGRAFVISSNLGDDFSPLGDGIVTAIDPATMSVIDAVSTGATNPQRAAIGPDGLLYVVNSENFVGGSLAIINPTTLELLDVIPGMGSGPGSISIDDNGLAYISGFFFGTLVWDTATRTFLRGPTDPVCAPLPGGGCRGAFDAAPAADGTLYQVFFGSSSQGLAPWIFAYSPGNLALMDSVSVGPGPTSIQIHRFR